jgi:photosystem II stability/assembly factor-like uncharacterized protein
MKKLNNFFSIIAGLILASPPVAAQWSAVRFDNYNTFTKIESASANDVFAIGTEPMGAENFFLRSVDGGTNWDSIALNTMTDQFQMTEISFPDATNGFIGGRKNNVYQNLQKTTDNGTTWTDITPDPSITEPIYSLFFLNSQEGWATCGRSLYITNNGGAAWSTINLSFIPQDIRFIDSQTGFIAGGDTTTWSALIMKTTDGGLTWNTVHTNSDALFLNYNTNINVVDANTVFVNQEWTNKLYFTTDAGSTWDSIICDSAFQITDFHFETADSGHVLADYGKLFYTNDRGATWNLAYTTEWGLYGPSVFLYSLNFNDGVGYVSGTSGLIKRFDMNLSGITSQLEERGGLSVYPSPCYRPGGVTIQSIGMKGECSLWIMNALGEVVYFENIQNIETQEQLRLNISSLATGTYTVVLHNESHKQTTKLIVAE